MGVDIHEMLKSCLAPSSPHGNDFGATERDFVEFKATIDHRMIEVSREVNSWTSDHLYLEDVDVLSFVTILRGEHNLPSLWATESSCQLSDSIFQSVSSHYEHSHNTPLCQDTKVVKAVLSMLRPKLLAATFRSNPAAIACYGWFLHELKSSTISNFLQDLLPTALIIADDYEPKNIKLGLECLHCIIDNVAMEKLKWFGYDDVITDVLKKCMYLKDHDIVSSHLKCFISLLTSSTRYNTCLKRNSFDEIINNVAVNMYMEQSLVLRRIYASYIPDLIKACGLRIVRHLTILIKILSEYSLESSTTSYSLKALASIVQVCWCRGDYVGRNVLVTVMKLLIVASRTPSHIGISEISPDLHLVANLLQDAFPAVINQFLKDMDQNRTSVDDNFVSLVENFFKTTPCDTSLVTNRANSALSTHQLPLS